MINANDRMANGAGATQVRRSGGTIGSDARNPLSGSSQNLKMDWASFCGPDGAARLQASVVVQGAVKARAAKQFREAGLVLLDGECKAQEGLFRKAAARACAWLWSQDLLWWAKNERPLGGQAWINALIDLGKAERAAREFSSAVAQALAEVPGLIEQIKSKEFALGVAQSEGAPTVTAKVLYKVSKDLLFYFRGPVSVRPRMLSGGKYPIPGVAWSPDGRVGKFVPTDSSGNSNTGESLQIKADKSGWFTGHLLADYTDASWFAGYGNVHTGALRVGSTLYESGDKSVRRTIYDAWVAAQGLPVKGILNGGIFSVASWKQRFSEYGKLGNAALNEGAASFLIDEVYKAQDAYRKAVLQPKLFEIETLYLEVAKRLTMVGAPADVRWQVDPATLLWKPDINPDALAVPAQTLTDSLKLFLGDFSGDPVAALSSWRAERNTQRPPSGQAPLWAALDKLGWDAPIAVVAQQFPGQNGTLKQAFGLRTALADAKLPVDPAIDPPAWINLWIDAQAQLQAYAQLAELTGKLGVSKSNRLLSMWSEISQWTEELYGQPLPQPPASGDVIAYYTQTMAKIAAAAPPDSLAGKALAARANLDALSDECSRVEGGKACADLAKAQQVFTAASEKVFGKIAQRRGRFGRALDRGGVAQGDAANATGVINLFAALSGKAVPCVDFSGKQFKIVVAASDADKTKIVEAKTAVATTVATVQQVAGGAAGSADANTNLIEKGLKLDSGVVGETGKENKNKAETLAPTEPKNSPWWIIALALGAAAAAKKGS